MRYTHMEEKNYLLELIQHKRKVMLKIAESLGVDSEKTLKCSQELDELIVKYQQSIMSERAKI